MRERDEGVRGRGMELAERSRRLPDRHAWGRGWREKAGTQVLAESPAVSVDRGAMC